MSALTQDFLRKKRTGDLGIEVEVESNKTLPTSFDPPVWSAKVDTSLRNNGIEYFTTAPILCNSKKIDSIKLLTDSLKDREILESPRTSVHVHVNILRHTPVQVWTAIATGWLLDNLLVRYCGVEEREGNVFCLRLKDAEGVLFGCLEDLKQDHPFNLLRDDYYKYSSQNINAINNFGSIEYRSMRGTIDPVLIDTWTTEIYNVVHRSKRFVSPEDMLDTYLSAGTDEFLRMVLSEGFIKELFKYGDANLIKENIGMLSELCYFHSWQKYEQIINERLTKKTTKDDFYIEPARAMLNPT